jgi:hypothetical protein
MAQSKRKASESPDRRAQSRQLTIRHGVITMETECAVFNVSASGAKLLLNGPMNFPDTFKLAVNSGPAKTCRIAWRKGNEYGVEFVEPNTAPGNDVRHSAREKIFDRAMIVYNDAFCSMDCEVLDYSPEGARLKPLNPRDCPVYFQLRIKHGPTHNCMVVRRQGRDFGVRFLPD